MLGRTRFALQNVTKSFELRAEGRALIVMGHAPSPCLLIGQLASSSIGTGSAARSVDTVSTTGAGGAPPSRPASRRYWNGQGPSWRRLRPGAVPAGQPVGALSREAFGDRRARRMLEASASDIRRGKWIPNVSTWAAPSSLADVETLDRRSP